MIRNGKDLAKIIPWNAAERSHSIRTHKPGRRAVQFLGQPMWEGTEMCLSFPSVLLGTRPFHSFSKDSLDTILPSTPWLSWAGWAAPVEQLNSPCWWLWVLACGPEVHWIFLPQHLLIEICQKKENNLMLSYVLNTGTIMLTQSSIVKGNKTSFHKTTKHSKDCVLLKLIDKCALHFPIV